MTQFNYNSFHVILSGLERAAYNMCTLILRKFLSLRDVVFILLKIHSSYQEAGFEEFRHTAFDLTGSISREIAKFASFSYGSAPTSIRETDRDKLGRGDTQTLQKFIIFQRVISGIYTL